MVPISQKFTLKQDTNSLKWEQEWAYTDKIRGHCYGDSLNVMGLCRRDNENFFILFFFFNLFHV